MPRRGLRLVLFLESRLLAFRDPLARTAPLRLQSDPGTTGWEIGAGCRGVLIPQA